MYQCIIKGPQGIRTLMQDQSDESAQADRDSCRCCCDGEEVARAALVQTRKPKGVQAPIGVARMKVGKISRIEQHLC